MSMKFRGTLEDLKSALKCRGVVGSWEQQPHGVHMMRCPGGGNLHWSSTTGSIWFDGKPVACARLENAVASILHDLE